MEALSSLALAFGLAAAPSLPPAPLPQGKAALAAPVLEIARLSLADIASAQAGGALTSGRVSLAAAFDHEGDAWLKVGVAGETRAFKLSGLAAGLDVVIGGERLNVSEAGGVVAAGAASVKYSELVARLFAAAKHAKPHDLLDYAVVAEKAGDMPASLCLIRRDSAGAFWITFRKPEELAKPSWFAAVNGVLKGFLLQGADLVFVEKAIEQSAAAAGFAEKRAVP
jgi:hypothetical protein